MIASLSAHSVNLTEANQVLDQVGLLARVKSDMTFLRIVYEAFQSQYPEQRGDMKAAFAANELAKVRTIAHSLKGNASTLGGQRVAATAADVMAACGDVSPSGVPALFRRLDAEVSQFQQAMNALLGH